MIKNPTPIHYNPIPTQQKFRCCKYKNGLTFEKDNTGRESNVLVNAASAGQGSSLPRAVNKTRYWG